MKMQGFSVIARDNTTEQEWLEQIKTFQNG